MAQSLPDFHPVAGGPRRGSGLYPPFSDAVNARLNYFRNIPQELRKVAETLDKMGISGPPDKPGRCVRMPLRPKKFRRSIHFFARQPLPGASSGINAPKTTGGLSLKSWMIRLTMLRLTLRQGLG